jgi:hypothetical protein
LPGTADARATGSDFFPPRAPYEFIESRLALCERCLCLPNSCADSRVVLSEKQIAFRYMLTLCNCNLDDGFEDLRPDLDAI